MNLSRIPTASIDAEIKAGALFVANHSGGKDSQAMTIKLLEIVPPSQLLIIHATLGESEWHGAQEHAQAQADAAGVPFIVTSAAKTFLEMVQHRHATRPDAPSWPSAQHRQCTSDLKRNPIQKTIRAYAKANGYTRVINAMGMRAAESSARAKKQCWTCNKTLSKAGRDVTDWLPIHGMSTSDVFKTIEQAGQDPHPAYATGNERFSCVFCIMGSDNDLHNGAMHNPHLYAKYCAAERATGYTMRSGRSLPDITGITPTI
jgi:DNA sulfur modification protein DndC